MNKFLTILTLPLLVVAGAGLGWGGMSEESVAPVVATPQTSTVSGLPTILPPSRYAALGKKSPFTLASTTEEAADFAKDLVLAGFVRLDGEEFIMVADKTKPNRVLVGKKPSPSAQGMLLLEVKKDPSGDPAKMEARIKKGSEVATLKYEVTGGGGAPSAPGMGQPVAAAPGTPTPPGTVPQPGQVQPGVQPGQKPVPAVFRRRPIPIVPKVSR